MAEDFYAEYRDHLREGMRIEIGIPLSAGGIFRDWAIISDSSQDLVQAQISRDVLPANVRIDVGTILDVSIWIKKDVYTCSGIVIEKLDARMLRIRLFGNFTLRERRQFFRIRLNLRIKYALLHDARRGDVEKDWAHRRDIEHMKFQGYDDFVIASQKARYLPVLKLEWQDILWSEVGLGGGGILIALPEPVQPDQFLNLQLLLPLTPPRLVEAVGQVIHVMAPQVQKGGDSLYPSGIQFVFLDERDRDLIFRHISATQIDHLRAVSDRREIYDSPSPETSQPLRWQQVLVKRLWVILFLIVLFYVVRYFIHYQQAGPSNEIQKTYEKAIRQYRHEDR